MSQIFSGSHWTDCELLDLLKELEKMYASGTRMAIFKDQQLQFSSTKELQQRMSDLRKELIDRGALTDSAGNVIKGKTNKQVRITTRNKGFNGKH